MSKKFIKSLSIVAAFVFGLSANVFHFNNIVNTNIVNNNESIVGFKSTREVSYVHPPWFKVTNDPVDGGTISKVAVRYIMYETVMRKAEISFDHDITIDVTNEFIDSIGHATGTMKEHKWVDLSGVEELENLSPGIYSFVYFITDSHGSRGFNGAEVYIPKYPTLSSINEVAKESNKIKVKINYTASKYDGDNDNATIKIGTDQEGDIESQELKPGEHEYTFEGLKANKEYTIEANVKANTTSANEIISTKTIGKSSIGEIKLNEQPTEFGKKNGSINNISVDINHDFVNVDQYEGKVIDSSGIKQANLENPVFNENKIKYDDVEGLSKGTYTVHINHSNDSITSSEKEFTIGLKSTSMPEVDKDKLTLPTINEGDELILDNTNLKAFVSGFSEPSIDVFIIKDLDGKEINTIDAYYSRPKKTFSPSAWSKTTLTAAQVDAGFNITLVAEEEGDKFSSEIFSYDGTIPIKPTDPSILRIGLILLGILVGLLVLGVIISVAVYWYLVKSRTRKTIFKK